MYEIHTPELIILDRVRESPVAVARMERMMKSISARRIVETDDAGLAEIIRNRQWLAQPMRTGQFEMTQSPAIIFSTFRWLPSNEFAKLHREHPGLSPQLLGGGAWTYRDAKRSMRTQECVCQSAYEIHGAYGCLHACDYCHIRPYFNIMLNVEELAARVREFGESIPEQNLYKFDNMTDTICLEPEYGASEILVSMFADWPGRYLLLYTKSDNVEHLLDLEHKRHTLISWTVSCETVASKIEKNTPSLEARIRAMELCQQAGYTVRIRFSPICPVRNWRKENRDMVRRVLERVRPDIISIDVLGWMNIAQMRGAMDLSLFDEEYVAALDRLDTEGFQPKGKHLWPHEMRRDILQFMIGEIKIARPGQPVSICMETVEMWQELGEQMGMSPNHYACCCGPTSVPGHPLLAEA